MKKIIISTLAILALTSCGAPKIESPTDALNQNQKAIFKNIEKLVNLSPTEGNNKGDIVFNADTKEGVLKGDVKYDFDFKQNEQKSKGNIKANIDINIKDKKIAPIEKVSGSIDLDLVSFKNKAIFKLNELKINNIEKNPQLAMITGIVAPFQKKWYFIELPKNPNTKFNQELLIKNQKEIVNILKEHTILEFVKENKNKDFYDYDVRLNSKNIISAIKKINKLIKNNKELTEDDISELKKEITKFNSEVKTNIKIDKNNLEYFILNFENKDGNLKIENKKKEFNFALNDNKTKLYINFNGKKSSKKLEGKINIQEEGKEIFNGNTTLEIDGKNTKVKFDGITNNNGEELKFNFSINDKTTEKSIKIEEPKDAKNFQEVIAGFMGAMMGGANGMGNIQPQIQIKKPKKVLEK